MRGARCGARCGCEVRGVRKFYFVFLLLLLLFYVECNMKQTGTNIFFRIFFGGED